MDGFSTVLAFNFAIISLSESKMTTLFLCIFLILFRTLSHNFYSFSSQWRVIQQHIDNRFFVNFIFDRLANVIEIMLLKISIYLLLNLQFFYLLGL